MVASHSCSHRLHRHRQRWPDPRVKQEGSRFRDRPTSVTYSAARSGRSAAMLLGRARRARLSNPHRLARAATWRLLTACRIATSAGVNPARKRVSRPSRSRGRSASGRSVRGIRGNGGNASSAMGMGKSCRKALTSFAPLEDGHPDVEVADAEELLHVRLGSATGWGGLVIGRDHGRQFFSHRLPLCIGIRKSTFSAQIVRPR
jgi:hypothetical protein